MKKIARNDNKASFLCSPNDIIRVWSLIFQTQKRGDSIMTQGVLPFKYEEEKKQVGLTSFGGLFVFMDLFRKMDLFSIVNRHLGIKVEKQGWSDFQLFFSLLLLNLCGCESVEDIEYLESDAGLRRVLKTFDFQGIWGKTCEKQKCWWRKKNNRSLPSDSSIFRFLELFHSDLEEENRGAAIASREAEIKAGIKKCGVSFIPRANSNLMALRLINQELVDFQQLNNFVSAATLDMDATIIESNKETAYGTYKGIKGYQPLNCWWSEQNLILHSEFRDGNVPAGYEQKRVLSESLDYLPGSIKKVYLRSDTAGYQWDLLNYCEKSGHKRFGRIEFAVGCDVTPEFKKEVDSLAADSWRPLYKIVKDERVEIGEWAEVPFVPSAISHSKNGPEYRFIAMREKLQQRILPGMESHVDLPFQTILVKDERYKLFGLVTNMEWEGESLIHWYHKRCGDSEHLHSEMKHAFCGGRFPSGKFGANAAWWSFMVMAINLTAILKNVALNAEWKRKRMKGLSLFLIRVAGRVISKGRQLIIRLSKGHPVIQVLLEVRAKIMSLYCQPSG